MSTMREEYRFASSYRVQQSQLHHRFTSLASESFSILNFYSLRWVMPICCDDKSFLNGSWINGPVALIYFRGIYFNLHKFSSEAEKRAAPKLARTFLASSEEQLMSDVTWVGRTSSSPLPFTLCPLSPSHHSRVRQWQSRRTTPNLSSNFGKLRYKFQFFPPLCLEVATVEELRVNIMIQQYSTFYSSQECRGIFFMLLRHKFPARERKKEEKKEKSK